MPIHLLSLMEMLLQVTSLEQPTGSKQVMGCTDFAPLSIIKVETSPNKDHALEKQKYLE
jgi:hypothetical protein